MGNQCVSAKKFDNLTELKDRIEKQFGVQIDNLKIELVEKEELISKLQGIEQSFNDQENEILSLNEKLKSKTKDLEKSNNESSDLKEEVLKINNSLKEKTKEYETKLRQFVNDTRTLSESKNLIEQELKLNQEELSKLKQEYVKLKEVNKVHEEDLEIAKDEMEEYEKEIERLSSEHTEKVKQYEIEKQKLKNEIAEFEKEIKQLHQEMELESKEQEQIFHQFEKDLTKEKDKSFHLSQQLDRMKQMSQKLEQKNITLQNEHQAKMLKLEQEYKRKYEQKQKEVSTLKEEKHELRETVDQISQEFERCKDQMKRQYDQELTKYKTEQQNLLKELNEMKEKFSKHEKNMNSLTSDLKREHFEEKNKLKLKGTEEIEGMATEHQQLKEELRRTHQELEKEKQEIVKLNELLKLNYSEYDELITKYDEEIEKNKLLMAKQQEQEQQEQQDQLNISTISSDEHLDSDLDEDDDDGGPPPPPPPMDSDSDDDDDDDDFGGPPPPPPPPMDSDDDDDDGDGPPPPPPLMMDGDDEEEKGSQKVKEDEVKSPVFDVKTTETINVRISNLPKQKLKKSVFGKEKLALRSRQFFRTNTLRNLLETKFKHDSSKEKEKEKLLEEKKKKMEEQQFKPLINSQKSLNGSILCKQFKEKDFILTSFEESRKWIYETMRGIDLFSRFNQLKNMFSEEEKKTIYQKKYLLEPENAEALKKENYSEADLFILKFLNLNNFETKFFLFEFLQSFILILYEQLKPDLLRYLQCSQSLKLSEEFKNFLSLVLGICNFLNKEEEIEEQDSNEGSQTPKKRKKKKTKMALGFNIRSLSNLSKVKSEHNPKETLLDIVYQIIMEKSPEMLKFKEEFRIVEEILQIKYEDKISVFDKFKSDFQKFQKLTKDLKEKKSDDALIPICEGLTEDLKIEILKIEGTIEEVNESLNDVAILYGQNKDQMESFFADLNDFLKLLNKTEENQIKLKIKEQKKRERELRKQQKKEKKEREKKRKEKLRKLKQMEKESRKHVVVFPNRKNNNNEEQKNDPLKKKRKESIFEFMKRRQLQRNEITARTRNSPGSPTSTKNVFPFPSSSKLSTSSSSSSSDSKTRKIDEFLKKKRLNLNTLSAKGSNHRSSSRPPLMSPLKSPIFSPSSKRIKSPLLENEENKKSVDLIFSQFNRLNETIRLKKEILSRVEKWIQSLIQPSCKISNKEKAIVFFREVLQEIEKGNNVELIKRGLILKRNERERGNVDLLICKKQHKCFLFQETDENEEDITERILFFNEKDSTMDYRSPKDMEIVLINSEKEEILLKFWKKKDFVEVLTKISSLQNE